MRVCIINARRNMENIPVRLTETIMRRHQARTCQYIIDNGIGYKLVSASIRVDLVGKSTWLVSMT